MTTHNVFLTESIFKIDNNVISIEKNGYERLEFIYKNYINDYPRFYKMDLICKLGFITSELLLEICNDNNKYQECTQQQKGISKHVAIILFSSDGSMISDIQYECKLQRDYPCAGDFVFTLPNIVIGEIAIRNQVTGITAMYLIMNKDIELIRNIAYTTIGSEKFSTLLYGWINVESKDKYEADIFMNEFF